MEAQEKVNESGAALIPPELLLRRFAFALVRVTPSSSLIDSPQNAAPAGQEVSMRTFQSATHGAKEAAGGLSQAGG